MEALEELAHSLRQRLVEHARQGGAGPGGGEGLGHSRRQRLVEPAGGGGGGRGGVEAQAARLVEHEAAALDPDTRQVLTARIVRLATGLGPLEPLLADPSVDEVMVNGPADVWVERRGGGGRAVAGFGAGSEVMHAGERGVGPPGRGGGGGA